LAHDEAHGLAGIVIVVIDFRGAAELQQGPAEVVVDELNKGHRKAKHTGSLGIADCESEEVEIGIRAPGTCCVQRAPEKRRVAVAPQELQVAVGEKTLGGRNPVRMEVVGYDLLYGLSPGVHATRVELGAPDRRRMVGSHDRKGE
jgi:hypothetical protein